MDDLISAVKDVETAKRMRKELTSLGDKAGFHIRKWISNIPEVLEHIPESDRASEIDLQKNELPTTKTPGVLWSAKDDTFYFVYTSPSSEFKFTKRNVLKKTATVFDPLGFSGGSSVCQNKIPQLILRYIYILKYLQSNFIG